MSATDVALPVDAGGHVITGAMGVPLVVNPTLVDATNWLDVFDLSGSTYRTRCFTGIAIRNPSAASTVEIAFWDGVAAKTRSIICGTQEFFVLDDLFFGPAALDDTKGYKCNYICARLGTAQGTAYSATITYSGTNITDGKSFNVNGKIYEFSSDGSLANPSSGNYLVDIGASADASWTNAYNKINSVDHDVIATINTGTNVLTITSVGGGAAADAIVMVDVDTAATFSATTLAGGSGGVAPVIHIW